MTTVPPARPEYPTPVDRDSTTAELPYRQCQEAVRRGSSGNRAPAASYRSPRSASQAANSSTVRTPSSSTAA